MATNHKPNVLVNGTNSNDTISNYPDYSGGAYNVTITASGGDDSIFNAGNEVLIDAGAGYDTIENNFYSNYDGWGNNVTILGGDGNDSIKNWRGQYVSIDGGSGRDTILSGVDGSTSYCTISGGTGDDRISIRSGKGSNNVFLYNNGDGNDTIDGFNSTSTLSISGSSYSTAESGRDVIVYVGDGSILLTWAATLPSINIVEAVSWKLNGMTATYGTSSNALITVNGVKSLDGISLSGSVVTVANSALNNSKVTISDGYTLKLASDVTAPSYTAESWQLSGTTAIYKGASNTAGYTVNNNQIVYTAAKSGDTFTVSGVKSTSGLSVSGNVVTVANSSLNSSNVTINNSNYKLALANGVPAPTTTAASWSYANNVVTYKAASTSSGYKVTNNQIVYTAASGGDTLFTVSGVKSSEGLSVSGNVVTVGNAALNQSTVTISDGYTLKLASDVTAPSTVAGGWTLNGTTATYKASKTIAGYSLANNQISYVTANNDEALIELNGVNGKPAVTEGSYYGGRRENYVSLSADNFADEEISVVSVSGSWRWVLESGNYVNLKFNAGVGNYDIDNYGSNISIISGTGNDTISN